jgi:hypothetical protein
MGLRNKIPVGVLGATGAVEQREKHPLFWTYVKYAFVSMKRI